MNTKRLLRHIHYWLSLAIFIPTGIMFAAGIFLMLKKEIAWIQPPSQKGVAASQLPAITYEQILETSRAHPEAGIAVWSDIDRIDVRPSKGIAKVQSKTGWEIQIDTANAKALSVAYRRSDVIESIHDGSYFTNWMKLFVFLPVGILLILMWGTGVYLFCITEIQKFKKRARQKEKAKTALE